MKPTITLPARALGLCIALGIVSSGLHAQSLAAFDPVPLFGLVQQLSLEDDLLPVIQFSGESQFQNGKAHIQIDQRSAEQIPDYDYNYQIMIMTEGDSQGMFISNKSNRGFTVTQLGMQSDSSGFSWTLIATPKPTEGGPTVTKLMPITDVSQQTVPAPRMVRNFEHIN